MPGVTGVTGVTGPGVTGVTGVGVTGMCETGMWDGVMGVSGMIGTWEDWLENGGYAQDGCVSPSMGW